LNILVNGLDYVGQQICHPIRGTTICLIFFMFIKSIIKKKESYYEFFLIDGRKINFTFMVICTNKWIM